MKSFRERIARKIAEPYLKRYHTTWNNLVTDAQTRYLFLADDIIDMFNKEILNRKIAKLLEAGRRSGLTTMFNTQVNPKFFIHTKKEQKEFLDECLKVIKK